MNCTPPFTAVRSVCDPWIRYGSFPVRIRNRHSVIVPAKDTDQIRNLVRKIFRKSFKKNVRENIRILLRKDYASYFRFLSYIIIRIFPGLFRRLFPVLFPEAFRRPETVFRTGMSRRDFRISRDLSRDSRGSFPAVNNEKIRRVSPPDFLKKTCNNLISINEFYERKIPVNYSSGFSTGSFPVFSLMHTKIPCSKGDHLLSGFLVTSPPM